MMKQRDTLSVAPGMFIFVEKWLLVELYGLQRERDTWKFGLYLLLCTEKLNYYIWRITLISLFSFSQMHSGNMYYQKLFFKHFLHCVAGA